MIKKSKKEIVWITIILILLAIILAISGIFYLGFVMGDFSTTGHVVLVNDNQSNNFSLNLSKSERSCGQAIGREIVKKCQTECVFVTLPKILNV